MANLTQQNSPDHEKFQLKTTIPDHRQHNDAPSQKTAMPRWRSRGKEKSTIALVCTWIVDHQISIALNILGLLFFTHIFFPQARNRTQKFFRISYFNPATGTFALGWDDIFFVFYWIIVFTGLRCIVMDYILSPIAAWCGLRKKKARVRFAEQAWIMLYDAMFWSTGMYIMYHSDYWLDLRNLWRNWPNREMEGLTKWYYLVQFAFWLQQIVVVNIEERRKDHWQMFSHHIVTCILVFTSYGYHCSKVGNVILCLMDVVDLFLPAAKILKYLEFKLPCDIMFGIFMITWFLARHVCYMAVIYSIFVYVPQEMKFGCYYGNNQNLEGPGPVPEGWNYLIQPFINPSGYICMTNGIWWFFTLMLLALQVILLIWFGMIMKVAYKVLSGQGADDTRSDDEDEDDEEENDIEEIDGKKDMVGDRATRSLSREDEQHITRSIEQTDSKPLLEVDISSTESRISSDSKFTRSPSRRSPRKKEDIDAKTTGISVRGKSHRKQLLGRIGCDRSGSE